MVTIGYMKKDIEALENVQKRANIVETKTYELFGQT